MRLLTKTLLSLLIGVLGVAGLAYGGSTTGWFTAGQRLGEGSTEEVLIGDFNGDGWIDLAEVNSDWSPDRSRISLNVSGTLSVTQELPYFSGGDVGDINGDGSPDLILADFGTISGGRPTKVYLNDGSGAFSYAYSLPQVNNEAVWDLVVTDLNGDGLLDVAEAVRPNNSGTEVVILLNQGKNTFLWNGQKLGPTGDEFDQCFALVQLDAEGDGGRDLALGCYGVVYTLINDGAGQFQQSQPFSDKVGKGLSAVDKFLPISRTATKAGARRYLTESTDEAALNWGLAAGDLNGDGLADLAVAQDGPFEIWINRSTTSTINFILGVEITTERSWDVKLVDLDDDGRLDAVVGQDYRNLVVMNTPTGFITETRLVGRADKQFDTFSVATADFNLDGFVDLVFGNSSAHFPPTDEHNETWLNGTESVGQMSYVYLPFVTCGGCLPPLP